MAEINQFCVEQNTAQTTTSSSWTAVSGASIAGSSLAASTKYLLIARGKVRTDATTVMASLRAATADDSTIAAKSESATDFIYTTSGFGYMFVHSFTTSATPTDVKFEFKSNGTATVTADQLTLLLLDLDDLGSANYFESVHAATGAVVSEDSANPDILSSIAGSDLGTTEEWLLLGSVGYTSGTGARNMNASLNGAEDAAVQSALQETVIEGEDGTSAERRLVGFAARHKAATSNVDADIQLWFDPYDWADGYQQGSYLIALKASAFADFSYDHNAGSITVPYYTTKTTTVASVGPYTPSTGGNHLILGWAESDASNRQMNVWLQDGTTDTRTGDYGDLTTGQNQLWDNSERAPLYVMERISFSTAKTYNLRGVDFSGASPSMANRWLIILNLNLASAGGSAATVTPGVVAAVTTVPAPSVAVPGTATPATVAIVQGDFSGGISVAVPTVTAGAAVTPGVVPVVVAVETPTATVSTPVTVTTNTVAAVAAVAAPGVTVPGTTAPTVVATVIASAIPTIMAGATVTPAVVPTVVVIETPTVGASATATVTPSSVATDTAVPTPTVTVPAAVTPAAIPAVISVATPTAIVPTAVTPAAIPAVVSVPTPTVTVPAAVTAATVAADTAVSTPTVTASPTVGPATVSALFSIDSPSVTAAATTTPGVVAVSFTVAHPTPSIPGSVTTSVVTGTVAIGSPTITFGATVAPAPVVAVFAVDIPGVGGAFFSLTGGYDGSRFFRNSDQQFVLVVGLSRNAAAGYRTSEGWYPASGRFALPVLHRAAAMTAVQATWAANKGDTNAALVAAVNAELNAVGYRRGDGTNIT